MSFTSPLPVTVGHLRIRFHGEGHRSIADRQLHMFQNLACTCRVFILEMDFFRRLEMIGNLNILTCNDDLCIAKDRKF